MSVQTDHRRELEILKNQNIKLSVMDAKIDEIVEQGVEAKIDRIAERVADKIEVLLIKEEKDKAP